MLDSEVQVSENSQGASGDTSLPWVSTHPANFHTRPPQVVCFWLGKGDE